MEQVIQFSKRAEQYTLALVILSLTVGGLSLFTTSYRWSRSLEQEVDRRTKELRETIAERKQAEEALRESELRYRTTLDSMADAIHLVGPDLRLTLINPTYKQIFRGLVSDTTDIIGRTVFEAFPSMPDEIRARVRDEYDQVFRTGKTLVTEESTMFGDKEVIIETRKIPIFEQGRVAQVVTVMRDVTERVRADKALQESKQRYQSIFDGVQDAIFVESTSGEILDANARACEMFGYSHDEFLTKTVADLVPPEHFALIPDTLPGSRIPHRPIETVNIRASGERFPVEITGQLQTIGGETVLLVVVRDITERKQVEETLRESEQEYRTMIEQSNDMIWTLDTEANFTFFNKRSEEISGYRLEDWRGKSFAPLVIEEDLPFVTDVFHKTLNGDPQHYEVRVKKPDGNILILSINTAPILKAGQVVGTVSFGRDITEHKQVEEALWESELRYRTTLNSMADAIHLVGPDLRFTLVNPAHQQWVREFGSGTPNYIGQTIFDVFPSLPDQVRDRMRDEYDQVFRTSETLVTEESTMFEDRELVTETRKIPVFEQGKVTQVITIMRDITEREQARREIETRRSYLESVLACAPDAIVTLDYQHNILEWNQGAERLFGYTWQEVVGRNIDDLITGPDTNVFEGATGWTQLALAGKNVPPTETFLYRKDGSLANIITSGSPILIGGKVSGVIAVYTDITERKRIEEQLRQQERLAAVGQLASGIAHDFNNILTIIMLYAQIAVGKSEGNLPPSAAQAFEIIIDESHKASQLVQQILDFSRHAMLNVQWLDLGAVTEEVIDVLQRMIPEDIHLTLEVELGEQAAPLVVQADSIRMQQVLVNLVTNARDAMPEGGDLRFGLSRVTLKPGEAVPVAEMSPGEWVCLAVSDTRTGMAEEVRSRIFEPFFTTKPVGEGTGLGLAQVYGIVRQHGGYIGVETEVGKGTTFHIYLPASAAGEEIAEEQGTALPQGQGETILLVEDKKKLRKAGQEILESLGYRVLTGANGREALETYRSAGEVDLVIADLVMPEMGGKELMRALREMQPTLKGLAITGYIVEEEVQELKKVGFLDTVYKPFKMDTLARMVRRALDED
ncbi:MAG: PAS domain S-box protein [Chloroflexi bacterium]|nr:PAS domain S-box protein [Chloroflexota bacterium]